MSVVTPRWREIPGFPGYDVSEEGDIRCWTYRGTRTTSPRQIIPYLSNSNRWAVKLMRQEEGKSHRVTMSLAVLILLAFRGEPSPQQVREVKFKDGNPYNIRLENIDWKTDLHPNNPKRSLDPRVQATNAIAKWLREKGEDVEVDHILPFKLGGEHVYANLRIVTRGENRFKSGKPPTTEELEISDILRQSEVDSEDP